MNPRGVSYHCWTLLVTIAFLYNALTISMLVFAEFNAAFYWPWILLNFATDLVNLADMVVQTRKAYFIEGILIRNAQLTLRRYIFRINFFVNLFFFCLSFVPDFLAILPTDFGLLRWPNISLLRLNRLAKLCRVSEFIAITEHNCPWPLSFRLFRLGTICYLLFHWNACLYFFMSTVYGYENSTIDSWTFSHQKIPDLVFPLCDPRFDVHRNECLMPETDWRLRPYRIDHFSSGYTAFGNLTKKYAMSFYWSALTLVTLGEQPWPENSIQSTFEIVDTLIGLLVFAAIIGDVGIMVSRAHLAKANFQEFVDGCKLYMQIRHVNQQMHDRVIKWMEYQWMGGVERAQPVDENALLNALPPRLARELAAEFHLNALIRSPVFAFCERGLLSELALRLQCHRFGPGDIVCRRGEIAKWHLTQHKSVPLLC
uniref:Ion transport domain-containing protein n=1 Tax=Globodera rostochiensis TaxID=31243 RepID=A0A914IEB2_GLORO